MGRGLLTTIVFLSLILGGDARAPIWKVFCSGEPLYRGRVDPIVNPGGVAGHTHKVAGGNHFSAAGKNQTPLQVFDDMYASSCTSCSIGKIDMSAYWHPDLYFQNPNGTFTLVPDGGLTIYYLSRGGSGEQANPDWQPIPKGLRMLAGDPYRRSFNGSLEERAVNYACLTANGVPGPSREPNNFPTDKYFCANGLRAQVFFPMCWNGVDLDSPDHKSHMAYPSGVDGGNCPSTHPVRIPGVFFEAFYSVSKFPHGQGTNPFVWSNGDPTGYGFHGDFLSGWNVDLMREALNNSKCDNGNPDMAFGNNVKACPPFAPYVQTVPAGGVCSLANPIPLTEDLGLSTPIASLPGCNPITNGPAKATPCSSSPQLSAKSPVSRRFLLKSMSTGLYVTAPPAANAGLSANVTVPTYYEVWNANTFTYDSNTATSLQNEGTTQYVSASGSDNAQLWANRGSPDGYEAFKLVPTTDSTHVVILSMRTSKYVQLRNSYLFPSQANVTLAEVFEMQVPDGGNVGISGTDAPVFSGSGFVPTGTYAQSNSQSGSNAQSGSTPAPSNLEGMSSSSSLMISFVLLVTLGLIL